MESALKLGRKAR